MLNPRVPVPEGPPPPLPVPRAYAGPVTPSLSSTPSSPPFLSNSFLVEVCCTPPALPRYGLALQREASFSFQLQDLSVDTVTRYVLLAGVHKNDALMDVSGEGKGAWSYYQRPLPEATTRGHY